jgi:hypothetical protein
MAAFAAGAFPRLVVQRDALVVRVAEEALPDVGVTLAADVAAGLPGSGLVLLACSRAEPEQEHEEYE